MTALSPLRAGTAAIALFSVVPSAATQSAPAPQFMPAPTPTADALAAQMRQLSSNPRDVYALIAAGELSTKLGDPAAALSFFGRAQAIEPGNPRIAAGKAGALILLERPGEALQLYAQAERAGVAMTPYLAQRGLAYDLTGQPGYAQRDYRRALLTARDDETVRRLALSLGISGHRDEAMTLLDPLLRRSDRAAWRARACVLAITGDVAGAQKIAASMMAGGAALSPFFDRLPSLSPADRAFAVHFGEVGSTVARANDARLAPALAALPVAPRTPPNPAPVVANAARAPSRSDARRQRPGRDPAAVAATTPTPTPAPAPAPAPLPSASSRAPIQLAMRDPLPSGRAPSPSPSSVARRSASPTVDLTTPADAQSPSIPTPRPSAPPIEIVTLPPRPQPRTVAAASPAPQPARSELAPASTASPSRTPVAPTPDAVAPRPVDPVVAAPRPTPAPVLATPTPAPVQTRSPEIARRNTAVLASIIETIAVPASELAVVRPTPTRAVPTPKPKPIETAAKVDPKAAKKADAKQAEPKKPEAKKPDPAKTDPARWWVQVAGGANAADLGKDWKRLTAKSPVAFRGKSAWTTPLRATNRLLAGPFKSQGEATAFVNSLAKDGASAFAWQSEGGQKIDRLAAK